MKKRTKVSSPLIPITTGIATGAVTLFAAAVCPALIPLALASSVLLHQAARKGIEHDLDAWDSGQADEIANAWEKTRQPGEQGRGVSHTLYSGGAFFDLPMTRTYHYELDRED